MLFLLSAFVLLLSIPRLQRPAHAASGATSVATSMRETAAAAESPIGVPLEGGASHAVTPPRVSHGRIALVVPGTLPPTEHQEEAPRPRKIVFICSGAGSMTDKWALCTGELHKAIDGLRPPQALDVIFMTDHGCSAAAESLLFATPANKRKIMAFANQTVPGGGKADPLPAVKLALSQHPDLIYLLSDAGFPDNAAAVAEIRQLNAASKTKIDTIAFFEHEPEYEKALKQIAADSGGAFKFASREEVKP